MTAQEAANIIRRRQAATATTQQRPHPAPNYLQNNIRMTAQEGANIIRRQAATGTTQQPPRPPTPRP
eukprot:1195036-Prorocentrum_minimum.AAC.19